MSDKVKFCVVGLGHIGKRHASIIAAHPQAELAAVSDANPSLRQEADKMGVPFFPSLEEMLASHTGADVINICTPNGLHAGQALRVLEKGLHAVIEKPMALKKADCEQVISAALKASRHVFIVKQNRYSPTSVWLKSLVDNNTIGKIFMVSINCYWNRDERYYSGSAWKGKLALDGGPLFTQFSHFVDIMYWIFGDIRNPRAAFANFNHARNTEFEDSGFVQFEFVSGGLGAISYSTSVWDTNLESSITVIGEKGSVKVGGQYMEKVEYCHIKDYVMPQLPPANPPNDYGPFKGSAANHHYVIQNVIDTVRGKGTIDTNALEGMKVVEMIEHIYSFRK